MLVRLSTRLLHSLIFLKNDGRGLYINNSAESGINLLKEFPRTTPIKLAITSANDEPMKTANGLLLLPLIAKVAI